MNIYQLFKFGGKSMQTPADSLQFVIGFIKQMLNAGNEDNRLIIVLSAFGKGTNALEYLYSMNSGDSFPYQRPQDFKCNPQVYFQEYADVLCKDNPQVFQEMWSVVENICLEITRGLDEEEKMKRKAQLLAQGEIITTRLVSHYLNKAGIQHDLFPTEDCIVTEYNPKYIGEKINFQLTENRLKTKFKEYQNSRLIIVPGYISKDVKGNMTNLGRDGSDFTTSLVSEGADVGELTLCKDVKGVFHPSASRNGNPISYLSYFHSKAYLRDETGLLIFPPTIDYAKEKNKLIKIAYFGDPLHPGTIIGPEVKV